jgi:anti-sigma regulatory factor (Ser/Thr protein kinase)
MGRVLIIGSDNPLTHTIVDLLSTAGVPIEIATGPVVALQCMRARCFAITITSPGTSIDEDLALFNEMRLIRPGIKCIVLAPHSTPQEIIAALRARVFACFTVPFDAQAIADIAREAASGGLTDDDIHLISARPGWVTVRANCSLLTAERLMSFARELSSQMQDDMRDAILVSFREIVLNAMEHGAAFNPEQMIEVTAVRTRRSYVFYVRDPGSGFSQELPGTDRIVEPAEGLIANLAANDLISDLTDDLSNPTDNISVHIRRREEEGLPPGGFGLLLARGAVDELLYNEIGNEVLLIKYIDRAAPIQSDPLVH